MIKQTDKQFQFPAIIKQIKITNNDTDSYVTLTLELNNIDLDINYLNNLRHKDIDIIIIDNN